MSDSRTIPAKLFIDGREGQEDSEWSLAGKTTVSIGRSFTNDIILAHSWISRRHAMIQFGEDQRYAIIDLGSANGTFVNQKMVHSPTPLDDGDVITLGSTTLVFRQQTPEEAGEGGGHGDLYDKTVICLQRESVSVLVCDIRGYTALSEEVGDAAISDMLQQWSGLVSEVVSGNGGRVDKFIGDAVMAVWSDQAGDHVLKALATAVAIRRLSARLGEEVEEIGRPLQVWAALNTGRAILGNIGVAHGRDYTIIGDVVNVAFRLEDLASRLGRDVLLGEQSFRKLEGAHEWFTPYTVSVRGKSEQLRCYGCDFPALEEFLATLEG